MTKTPAKLDAEIEEVLFFQDFPIGSFVANKGAIYSSDERLIHAAGNHVGEVVGPDRSPGTKNRVRIQWGDDKPGRPSSHTFDQIRRLCKRRP